MKPRFTLTDNVGPAAGKLVADALASATQRGGKARLAVPGGRSPVTAFAWLAKNLPAAVARRTVLTLTDERHSEANPAGDWEALPENSNLRTVWAHWLSRADDRPSVVSLDAPGPLDQALVTVSREFRAHVGRLDVLLLGVGEDGHIASLFPGHGALAEPGPVIAVSDSPKPPAERLSLSLRVLSAARFTVVVATGAGKADALRRALAGDDTVPLGLLKPRGDVHWVLDPPAAARLELT